MTHVSKIFVLLAVFFLAPAFASAATYYVATTGSDSNSCSAAQNISTPKLTIAGGIGCLAAGDTLYIRGGTYTENIDTNSVNIPTGISWTNAVTIAGGRVRAACG